MKFIGHLDLMRYFQKCMRRAGIPIKYSEGFSPHQIMSFAAPLGVGLTSNGEYMDIEVSDSEASSVMVQKLNDAMVEGMTVLSWRRLPDNAKNAMSIVAAADYTVAFREGHEPADWDVFTKDFMAFYNQADITILKKTKKSEKEIDIKPMIYDLHIEDQKICMQVSTGSANNLKPELVLEAYCGSQNTAYEAIDYLIQREEVYADLGDEANRKLVTLEDLGEEIE